MTGSHKRLNKELQGLEHAAPISTYLQEIQLSTSLNSCNKLVFYE